MALDDCWQTYNWVLDCCENILGVKPENIILVGDSAGGSLAMSLTLLAQKSNRQTPVGIYMIYPAMSLEDRNVTPSLMKSINDPILPVPVLKMAKDAYRNKYQDSEKDALFSPSQINKELLKNFPPIRVVVGEEDPLQDECWKFVEKAVSVGVDIKMKVYKEICHGLINLAFNLMGSPSGNKIVKEGSGIIKELFTLADQR